MITCFHSFNGYEYKKKWCLSGTWKVNRITVLCTFWGLRHEHSDYMLWISLTYYRCSRAMDILRLFVYTEIARNITLRGHDMATFVDSEPPYLRSPMAVGGAGASHIKYCLNWTSALYRIMKREKKCMAISSQGTTERWPICRYIALAPPPLDKRSHRVWYCSHQRTLGNSAGSSINFFSSGGLVHLSETNLSIWGSSSNVNILYVPGHAKK